MNDIDRPLPGLAPWIGGKRALAALKGRFILSLNDVPEVRRLFACFQFEAVETTYCAGSGSNAHKASEVPISGP